MAFILEDDLAQAAHLSELTPEQTRLVLAVGPIRGGSAKLTLAQAADLAGLDRLAFQCHLAAPGIPLQYGQEGFDMDLAELARRGV
jgi:predicted HTH domain antitoxin